MNDTDTPTPPTKFADWQRERMADAPPTLPELITILADRQPHLARLQDELERMTEHVAEFEQHDRDLRGVMGELAITTGECKPHPAIEINYAAYTSEGKLCPLVTVERDLSAYRSDGNKRTGWCAGCIAHPDKCGGSVGVSCGRYPLILETNDYPLNAEAYEKGYCGSG